jgi:hypothetical protein
MITGVPRLPHIKHICENCVMGKHHRDRFPKRSTTITTRPLQVVHTDLCGPIPVTSLSGARYILTFIDDYTHMTWVYFIKTKSTTLQKFQEFAKQVEISTGHRISQLRSDRGGEYTSLDFSTFCKQRGIHHQFTAAYSPQQNGKAERKNRSLLETARALARKLPGFLWEEAVRAANYIRNRCPTRALYHITPYEKLTGMKPDLSHLRIFGSTAYCHIPREKRTKLDPKAIRTIFVGYDSQSKAYRCYCPLRKKILLSRDVLFDETEIGNFLPHPVDPLELSLFDPLASSSPLCLIPELQKADPTSSDLAEPHTHDIPEFPNPDSPTSPILSPTQHFYTRRPPTPLPSLYPRRSNRPRRQSVRLHGYDLNLCFSNHELKDHVYSLEINDP